jgi:hypothetical protein
MNRSTKSCFSLNRSRGFSLIEVVLAIGIFLVTVLALVGLLGPTLQSVDEVEKTDEVSSVVNTVNAFLQNSPSIATVGLSKFSTIYNAVAADDSATLFVFRSYRGATSDQIDLKVGFLKTEAVGTNAMLQTADFTNAAGTIFRVVLTPSSVIPLAYHHATTTNPDGDVVAQRDSTSKTYKLSGTYKNDVNVYLEGSFAMEVRIYAEDPAAPGVTFSESKLLGDLLLEEPIFTYNTAIVR